MEWKNIYRGFIMGASDVIPGVSGGTIAILLGIYDRLIAAINGLFSKEWKKHLYFLIPLGLGIVLALFSLSRLMEWLFEMHQASTYIFFLGLIIGVLPFLLNQANAKNTFKRQHYVLLLIGALIIASIKFMHPSEGDIIENITLSTYMLLFVSGFIGSCAMILPGVSGSFMLLIIGVFPTVISAISNFQLDIIAVTGTGIAIGMLTMSKVIHYFLTHYHTGTFAIIIGMVIGSIFVIFPGWPEQLNVFLINGFIFCVGLLTAYLLGKVEYK